MPLEISPKRDDFSAALFFLASPYIGACSISQRKNRCSTSQRIVLEWIYLLIVSRISWNLE